MDEVAPPNVVISKQFITEQSQNTNLTRSCEWSSSPEVEKNLKNSDECVPPNITITSKTLPENIQNCFSKTNFVPLSPFTGEIRVPKSFQESNFHLQVLSGDDSNPPRMKKSDFNWIDTLILFDTFWYY